MSKKLVDFKKALKTESLKEMMSAGDVEQCANMFFQLIQEKMMTGDEVQLPSIGKFYTKQRDEYQMFDQFTKTAKTAKPRKTMLFKTSTTLKRKLNEEGV